MTHFFSIIQVMLITNLYISQRHVHIAEKSHGVQLEYMQLQKSKEAETCHQVFKLTSGNPPVTYETYKDRIDNRVEGTCEWFLHHQSFVSWVARSSRAGPLLVSADPGCGKSVLAKYLVDEGLVSHGLPESAAVCYFFFKDALQDSLNQALCAVLHQLFSHRPSLIKHALTEFS
jgi:hypothetical protein